MKRFLFASLMILVLHYFPGLPVMVHAASDAEYVTIAILGDSRSDGKEGVGGVNEAVLSKLFSMAKEKNPRALFFSGDLTLGLEEEEVAEDLYKDNVLTPQKQEKKPGDHWARMEGRSLKTKKLQ